MGTMQATVDRRVADPLDLLEEFASTRGWPSMRAAEDEFVTEPSRRWCAYRLHAIWHRNLNALHLHCGIDIKVPDEKRGEINELLSIINDRMWLGHFTICADDTTLTFRYTLLTRRQNAPAAEQLEDMLEAALEECDRHYPAFQFVLWGGRGAEEALSAALIDTVGEA